VNRSGGERSHGRAAPLAGFAAGYRLSNLRHLCGRPLRSLLTVGGVAAAVALVVSVGVMADTLDRSLRLTGADPSGAADIEVIPSDSTGLSATAIAQIRGIAGVRLVVPVVRAYVNVEGPKGTERVLALGLDPNTAFGLAPSAGHLDVESGSATPGGPGLLLSPALARDVGVRVGGVAGLVTPSRRWRIAGVGRASGGALDRLGTGRFALMRLAAAQTMLGRPGRVDTIYVTVARGRYGSVSSAIRRALRGRALVGQPRAISRGFERAFAPLRTLGLLAALSAMFVAAALTYNTLAMMLAERRRELAMMLAFGASRRHIVGAFLLDAALLGAIGCVAGAAAGLVLAGSLAHTVSGLPGAEPTAEVIRPVRLAIGATVGIGVALAGAAVAVARVTRVTPVAGLSPIAAYEWQTAQARVSTRAQVAIGLLAAAFGTASMLLAEANPGHAWLAAVTLALWLVAAMIALRHTVPLAVGALRLVLARPLAALGRIAFGDLSRNPARLTLTAGAVMITSGLAIAVTAADDSYRSAVVGRIDRALGAPIYVMASNGRSGDLVPPLSAALAKRVSLVTGVRAAYPERLVGVEVGGQPTLVTASPVARAARAGISRNLISVGTAQTRLLEALGTGKIAISAFARQRLHTGVGDTVTVTTPGGDRRLRVGAIWEGTAAFNEAYVEQSVYARLWRDGSSSRLAVFPAQRTPRGVAIRRINDVLEGMGAAARAVPRERLVGDARRAIDSVIGIGYAIQLACLLVAILAVANTMFIAVLERRWEFALGRSLGMTRRQVAGSLLVESAAVGFIGGVGGALFGTATAYAMTRAMNAGYGWNLVLELPLVPALMTIAAATFVAAVAATPAAWIALRPAIAAALNDQIGSTIPRWRRARFPRLVPAPAHRTTRLGGS
jgi:putative ABC transport system permease protein